MSDPQTQITNSFCLDVQVDIHCKKAAILICAWAVVVKGLLEIISLFVMEIYETY